MSNSDIEPTSARAFERDDTSDAEGGRRPYEPPEIESGDAFEKVVLVSGCNETIFCPIPC